MRRKETKTEMLYRYRGVVAVVMVPVALVLIVVAFMPRAAPHAYPNVLNASDPMPDHGLTTTTMEKFAIVIDAGSTGSRVHIFKFQIAKGQLDLISDTFEQLKPGLSSYPDDPQAAAESLQPLLDTALKTVPTAAQGVTKIKVGATAGLRLLPGNKADLILEAVAAYLKKSPFALDSVTVLDGKDEGGFAWLTLNYLLGNLGKPEVETTAAIDLGGGSVQEAFAMTEAEAKTAPDTSYILDLKGAGKTYHVYVHSYLGYGLMAGRAEVLAWEETREANPCVPTDHSGVYVYAGKQHTLVASPSGASFDACSKVVMQVLQHEKDCGAPKAHCAFNGAWVGPNLPKVFHVSSYFWDRATDIGLIPDTAAISVQVQPRAFKQAGEAACKTPLDGLAAAYPAVSKEQAPFLCLDLSFCYTLLSEGFDLPDEANFTLVKKIKYKAEEVEAAWPLGAAINLLS